MKLCEVIKNFWTRLKNVFRPGMKKKEEFTFTLRLGMYPERELPLEDCIEKIESSGLPDSLIKYLVKIVRKIPDHPITRKARSNPGFLLYTIKDLIDRASQITGLNPTDLIRATDLDFKDFKPVRLEACFSELRAILYLANEGFSNIELLGAEGTSKSADIVADRKTKKYAFDVATISGLESRINLEKLGNKIHEIAVSKQKQLKPTKEKYDCDRTGVLVVINPFDILMKGKNSIYAPMIQNVFEDLKKAYEDVGLSTDFHITIITGVQVVGDDPDETVYPPWSNE